MPNVQHYPEHSSGIWKTRALENAKAFHFLCGEKKYAAAVTRLYYAVYQYSVGVLISKNRNRAEFDTERGQSWPHSILRRSDVLAEIGVTPYRSALKKLQDARKSADYVKDPVIRKAEVERVYSGIDRLVRQWGLL